MIDMDGKIDMLSGLASRIGNVTEKIDQRTEQMYLVSGASYAC
jgi:hypothetical protein